MYGLQEAFEDLAVVLVAFIVCVLVFHVVPFFVGTCPLDKVIIGVASMLADVGDVEEGVVLPIHRKPEDIGRWGGA